MEAVLKERISSCCIHHKVKLGLLALGKSKYGTWDSQKQPYTVQKILGNFRRLKILDARFLLGLYCVIYIVFRTENETVVLVTVMSYINSEEIFDRFLVS